MKNAWKPGAQFDKGSAGELHDALGAAESSSPAQMMDVMGLCEGCGQMPVAFVVLALGGEFSYKALVSISSHSRDAWSSKELVSFLFQRAFPDYSAPPPLPRYVSVWSKISLLCAPEKGVYSQQLPYLLELLYFFPESSRQENNFFWVFLVLSTVSDIRLALVYWVSY